MAGPVSNHTALNKLANAIEVNSLGENTMRTNDNGSEINVRSIALNDTTTYDNVYGFQVADTNYSFGDFINLKVTNSDGDDVTLSIYSGVIYPAKITKFFATGSDNVSITIFEYN